MIETFAFTLSPWVPALLKSSSSPILYKSPPLDIPILSMVPGATEITSAV